MVRNNSITGVSLNDKTIILYKRVKVYIIDNITFVLYLLRLIRVVSINNIFVQQENDSEVYRYIS